MTDTPLPGTAGAAKASRNAVSVIVMSADHDISTENICAMHIAPAMDMIIPVGLSIEYDNGIPTFTSFGLMPIFVSQSSMEVESVALLEAVEGRDVPIGCRLLILNAYPVENLTIAETNLYFVLLAVVLPLVVGAVGVVCRRRKFR